MHREALEWVAAHATADPVAVLDVGGRNINGSPRPLFAGADPYVVLDIRPDPGVDVVADAATWLPDRPYDVVVCCEVFEHTARWVEIVATAWAALRPGGQLILTMAGPGRPEHSGIDGGSVRPGEHYANVRPGELAAALATFASFTVDVLGHDVRAVAVR